MFTGNRESAVGDADLDGIGGQVPSEVGETPTWINGGNLLGQWRRDQITSNVGDCFGFEQKRYVRRQIGKQPSAPNRVRAGVRIVIPGKDENWNRTKLFEQSQHGRHQGVVNLVILKQITCDNEGVNLPVTSGF